MWACPLSLIHFLQLSSPAINNMQCLTLFYISTLVVYSQVTCLYSSSSSSPSVSLVYIYCRWVLAPSHIYLYIKSRRGISEAASMIYLGIVKYQRNGKWKLTLARSCSDSLTPSSFRDPLTNSSTSTPSCF